MAYSRPSDVKPDFTVKEARLVSGWKTDVNNVGFVVRWATESAGFGELSVHVLDGRLTIDNERMTKGFVKEVLSKLVDSAELVDPEPEGVE